MAGIDPFIWLLSLLWHIIIIIMIIISCIQWRFQVSSLHKCAQCVDTFMYFFVTNIINTDEFIRIASSLNDDRFDRPY